MRCQSVVGCLDCLIELSFSSCSSWFAIRCELLMDWIFEGGGKTPRHHIPHFFQLKNVLPPDLHLLLAASHKFGGICPWVQYSSHFALWKRAGFELPGWLQGEEEGHTPSLRLCLVHRVRDVEGPRGVQLGWKNCVDQKNWRCWGCRLWWPSEQGLQWQSRWMSSMKET